MAMGRGTYGVRLSLCLFLALVQLIASCCICNASVLSTLHQQHQLSAARFDLTDWKLCPSTRMVAVDNCINVTVPSTVLAGLVEAGVYKDPFYAKNIFDIKTDQFETPWIYRTIFNIPRADATRVVTLHFEGINYKANIWLNNVKIGDAKDVVGTFRYFEFDLPSNLLKLGDNSLEVEVFMPNDHSFPPDNNSTDLAITFVDWAPHPPDYNMGLWRKVYITITGAVSLMYPMVESVVTTDLKTAHLTVLIEATNHFDQAVTGMVVGELDLLTTSSVPDRDGNPVTTSIDIAQRITVPAKQTVKIFFHNTTYPQLNIDNPPLWWPWQMGQPLMHNLSISFVIDEQEESDDGDRNPLTVSSEDVQSNGVAASTSDSITARFGIRQITSELDKNKYRLYKVNHKPILIRGAGWAPDLFQRAPREWLQDHMRYVRDMNLNAIRQEGKMEDDYYFDLADEYGLLMMPGWCCCDSWQHWKYWTKETLFIAGESLRTQLKRLRIHPSILVFLYSSDELPPLDVEKTYLKVVEEVDWPNPVLESAADTNSPISGPSGVKMSGPYSWVPPNYWLLDKDRFGGAYSFLTEGGPGENPLTYESLARTIPESDMWPMNSMWDAHCGNPLGVFRNLRFFTPPLNARYGTSNSAQEYLEKAQAAVYESHRAMFEAYSRNKYTSTGVIQWMLNNAWPEMIWHLYDYYMTPSASYFATKKACEPIHIMYSYNDASVWVINSMYTPFTTPLMASAAILNVDGTLVHKSTTPVAMVAEDSSRKVIQLPLNPNGVSKTYFVSLQLYHSNNASNIVSDNFYWLSTQQDVLEWDDTNFYRTPCSSYADMKMLSQLNPITLVHHETWTNNNSSVEVQVTNPSTKDIALLVRLRVVKIGAKKGDEEVLPIIWDDNYFTLLPKQTRLIHGKWKESSLGAFKPSLIIELYNNIVH